MNRRSFIRSAAGFALLSPFLSRVQRAEAQAMPTPRFVFFVEGNGYEPRMVLSPSTRTALDLSLAAPIADARYWPRRYRHAQVIETAGDLAQASSLQDLGDLAPKTAVLLGLSSKITGGGHSAYHGVLSSTRTAGERPSGVTIDAHLSNLPRLAGTAHAAYRVGHVSTQFHPGVALDYGTCALGPGVSAPLVLDPGQAFDRIFSPLVSRPTFERTGRMLDFAREDVTRALAAFPGSSVERVKLERYLEAIEENIERRRRLDARLMGSVTPPPRPGARNVDDFYPVLDAQAGHIASALIGGLTNVAVMGIGSGFHFDTFYDRSHAPRHDTHHSSESSATARDYIYAQGRLQMAVMIALARRLEAVPEGNGTLLDHTVLVYIGDNGETHHASADEFPVVLMGGGALGLRTGGRTLVYPGLDRFGSGHRQVSNLWNTLGHLAGESLSTFGGEKLGAGTRSAEGPLAELMP